MKQSSTRAPDGWDSEQHLAACSIELSKVKGDTEEASSKMVSSLSSPFKVSKLPCEDLRLLAEKCFESNQENENDKSLNKRSSGLAQYCFKDVQKYYQCSLEKLEAHKTLATALAEKSASFSLSP